MVLENPSNVINSQSIGNRSQRELSDKNGWFIHRKEGLCLYVM